MGRRLDRAFLLFAVPVALYFFYLSAWQLIVPACLAAFISGALLRVMLRFRPAPRRRGRSQAAAALARLCLLPDEEALAEIAPLLRRRYPGEDFDVAVVLKHPDATLSSGDVLNAWKANRQSRRLVVAATCPCEDRAALFARELTQPALNIIDSRKLLRLLKDTGAQPPPAPRAVPLRERVHRLALRASTSRVGPRQLCFAAGSLAAYLRYGNPLCLFAALITLFHIGVALFQRRLGSRLFDPGFPFGHL